MKRAIKGLATLFVCGALNFGLTADVQATELESIDSSDSAYQEMYGSPPPGYGRPRHRPPPDDHWGHRPPPPPPDDHWGHRPPPPPPDDRWGHRPPPPDDHWGHRPPPYRR